MGIEKSPVTILLRTFLSALGFPLLLFLLRFLALVSSTELVDLFPVFCGSHWRTLSNAVGLAVEVWIVSFQTQA